MQIREKSADVCEHQLEMKNRFSCVSLSLFTKFSCRQLTRFRPANLPQQQKRPTHVYLSINSQYHSKQQLRNAFERSTHTAAPR